VSAPSVTVTTLGVAATRMTSSQMYANTEQTAVTPNTPRSAI
jgi:hypothetical protein